MKKKSEPKKPLRKISKDIAPVAKNEIVKKDVIDASMMADLVLKGDLRQFDDAQKVKYYSQLCQSLGLNPMAKPFDLIVLNGREVLYANRGCSEQLRKIHGVSVVEMKKEMIGDIFTVTVKVQDSSGRFEISTGAVSIKGLQGDALANKYMTAETKAKRRATLSICGLGMLDELEVATIPGVKYENNPMQGEQKSPAVESQVDDRLAEIPYYIIDGFKILGLKTNEQIINACKKYDWNFETIKIKVDEAVAKMGA